MDRKYIVVSLSAFLLSLLVAGVGCCPLWPVRPIHLPSTPTPMASPTPIHSPVITWDPTPVPTHTATHSPTPSPTNSPIPSPTNSATNSPTKTPTNTPVGTTGTILPTNTFTFTPSPSPIATACQTAVPLGDTAGTGTVVVNGTLCQRYVSSRPLEIDMIFVDLAASDPSVTLGIYSDNAGYPGNLLWDSPATSMAAGYQFVPVQNVPGYGNPKGISLPAGAYWLAVSGSGPLSLVAASGSTESKVVDGGRMPDPFTPGDAISNTGQATLSAEVNTCYANFTQVPTFTPVPATSPTPVATSDPTPVPSNTPTNTPTSSPTGSPTPCHTYAPWGETSLGSGSVTVSAGNTVFQSYYIPTGKFLNAYVDGNYASAGASIQMAIYADGGGYPTTQVFVGTATSGASSMNWMAGVPYGGVAVTGGTYWLAFSVLTGSMGFTTASGSSAKMTTVPAILPATVNMATASPNPPAATRQLYMGGYYSNCP